MTSTGWLAHEYNMANLLLHRHDMQACSSGDLMNDCPSAHVNYGCVYDEYNIYYDKKTTTDFRRLTCRANIKWLSFRHPHYAKLHGLNRALFPFTWHTEMKLILISIKQKRLSKILECFFKKNIGPKTLLVPQHTASLELFLLLVG